MLLKCVFGTKIKMRLHQSIECIIQHTEETYQKRKTGAYKQLESKKQNPNGKSDDSREKEVQRLLSPNIVEGRNDSDFDQHRLSRRYKCADVLDDNDVILWPHNNV